MKIEVIRKIDDKTTLIINEIGKEDTIEKKIKSVKQTLDRLTKELSE